MPGGTSAPAATLASLSITAPSTADAVQRVIEVAPQEVRKAVQSATAEAFRGAIAQVLLKKAGGGLIAAREVLLATAPVSRVISEDQLGQLPLALESGRKHGMVSFTDALVDLVRSGTVDVREAFRKTPDRDRLLEHLKRQHKSYDAIVFVSLCHWTTVHGVEIAPERSVVVPYLIMQPAFGLGIAASRTPQPLHARLRSLMAHTAFGVGLYLSAVGASHVVQVGK